MIHLIQALAFTLTAFCTAARHHEISGAKPINASVEGRMRSATRKMERAFGGRERDWPLHPLAVSALALQERLASVIRPKDQNHLWVQLQNYQGSGKGGPLANMTEPMVAAVEHLGLEADCDGRPHAHRWRHTLVRLIALAIVQSMQVLQDLLGHDDLEALLHYLLSAPDLVAEVMQVAEEASQLVVRTAVEETVQGRTGGGAAQSLQDGLTGMAMRRGIDVLGTDNIDEAVRILAGRGLQCTLVRPGILCTKAPGQPGPCTKGRGLPDTGSCRSDCESRLELASARLECRNQITGLLREYAESSDRPLAAQHIRGKILANLHRWPNVRDEFLASSPIAAEIWSSRR